jgi:hypothetical protein
MSSSFDDEPTSSEAAIKQLLVGLRGLKADVAGRFNRLEDTVTTLRTDVMARIDRLQDALTEQQQSDLVNWSAGERAEKIAKDARAAMQAETSSLGDEVRALVRMVKTLQTRVDHLERKEEG